jgi:hypothetical protein
MTMAKAKSNVIKLTPPTEPPSPKLRELSADEVRILLTGLGIILKSVDSLTTQYKLTTGWLARHGITFSIKDAPSSLAQDTTNLANQKRARGGQYVIHWRDAGGFETFHSLHEVAEYLKMNVNTLRNQISKGGGKDKEVWITGHGSYDDHGNAWLLSLRFVSFSDLPGYIDELNERDRQG